MTGTLYGVGVGPGDPELITLKAARIIGEADVVAYFAKRGKHGNSRNIAEHHIGAEADQLRLEYPYTTEIPASDPRYVEALEAFYNTSAAQIGDCLAGDRSVAVLCEGDPFLYGSFMHLYDRLNGDHATEVVPGITSMSGCWTRAGTPMTRGNECLSVLAGTIEENKLVERLEACDAAVIMKVGRNLPKVRSALARAGLTKRAIFVERGTMSEERIVRLCEKSDDRAPYFSLVLVPGSQAGP